MLLVRYGVHSSVTRGNSVERRAKHVCRQGSDMIDWGYLYVSFLAGNNNNHTINSATHARTAFLEQQGLPAYDTNHPRKCNEDWPVHAITWDFVVTPTVNASSYIIFAYDEVLSMVRE